jgi:hypothetical protein
LRILQRWKCFDLVLCVQLLTVPRNKTGSGLCCGICCVEETCRTVRTLGLSEPLWLSATHLDILIKLSTIPSSRPPAPVHKSTYVPVSPFHPSQFVWVLVWRMTCLCYMHPVLKLKRTRWPWLWLAACRMCSVFVETASSWYISKKPSCQWVSKLHIIHLYTVGYCLCSNFRSGIIKEL